METLSEHEVLHSVTQLLRIFTGKHFYSVQEIRGSLQLNRTLFDGVQKSETTLKMWD